jgi:hypothetical protein
VLSVYAEAIGADETLDDQVKIPPTQSDPKSQHGTLSYRSEFPGFV